IGWGLIIAATASAGVVVSAPLGSATLTLVAVALTGAAGGMVFKGGSDLCTLIAPPQDRGKLISSYYVACYLGGFSVPLLVIGVLSDIIGLAAALGCLTVVAIISAIWTWRIGLRSVHALSSPEVGAPQA
ncbi:MAG: hypothetical protein OEM67_01220, partial [Thermoleophilia bacterium]|nr:hypothetical protein [Thermoleophilia bacterium]